MDSLTSVLCVASGLNEVFQGGLSSYSLVNMIVAHLQCEGFDASDVVDWIARTQPMADGGRRRRRAGRKCETGKTEPAGEEPVPLPSAIPLVADLIREEGAASAAPTTFSPDDLMSYLREVADMDHHKYDLGMLLTSFLQR